MAEIRNPNSQLQGPGGNNGGGDMRSMLAFTTLALVVLLVFQYFKPKEPPAPPAPQQSVPVAQSPAQNLAQSTATSPTDTAAAGGAGSAPVVTAASESLTVVENELYRITFTNRGAQVKSWILKRYTDAQGKPLDLVNQGAAARFGYPLALYTYESGLTAQLNSPLYQASATGQVAAPASLVFRYERNGLSVTKSFHFDSTYEIGIDVRVARNGSPVRALVEWPSGLGDQEDFPQYAQSQFAWSINGKHNSANAGGKSGLFGFGQPAVANGATLDQPYEYAAATDLYFAAAFLPVTPSRATVVTLLNSVDIPKDLANPAAGKIPATILGIAAGDTSGATSLRLFAGPKQFDVLSDIHAIGADGRWDGVNLRPLIQFGWLTIIAEPLFLLLRFVYEHLLPGNWGWGWSIVLVTLVFNLAMLPTRLSMMKSSLKMQRIQPRLDALKKKYAQVKMGDPRHTEMGMEQMRIYKEEGINMYGSCLPMLVQMPLFFAYYRVLANVIELRHAHWGWLADLSIADPLHILPIVIIASMFLVQLVTPTAPGMDPAQKRMMAFMMPAIFGFSMWHFASGLALYWATGNLLNLMLQFAINNSKMGREMAALAAKRAAKQSGKVIQGRR